MAGRGRAEGRGRGAGPRGGDGEGLARLSAALAPAVWGRRVLPGSTGCSWDLRAAPRETSWDFHPAPSLSFYIDGPLSGKERNLEGGMMRERTSAVFLSAAKPQDSLFWLRHSTGGPRPREGETGIQM